MSASSRGDAGDFSPGQSDALHDAGWIVTRLPGSLTLAGLRDAGVPFKGTRYFDTQALDTVERTTVATDVAYRPGLLPDCFNRSFESAQQCIDDLNRKLPPGAVATIAPAAAYVWLCQHHLETHGTYPFSQCFTWAIDRYQDRTNLVVGIFGQRRPVLVAPLSEGRGAGVGVWPIVFPRSVASTLWPSAHSH